jgi:hypothetical protein
MRDETGIPSTAADRPAAEPAGADPPAPVGYKRPPVAHRFKKGQSGNPRGRPKHQEKPKAPDSGLEDLILREAYRVVEIRENGRVESMPMIQAVMRSLGVLAAKGNLRAQKTIVELVQAVEQRRLDDQSAAIAAARAYKKSYQEEFAACDRAGKPRPDPVPHPDDILIDTRARTVKFNGPVDEHQKAQWDADVLRKAVFEDEIKGLKKEAKRHADDLAYVARLEEYIEREQTIVDEIGALYPSETVRRVPGFDIDEWRKQKKYFLEITRSLRRSARKRK